MALSNRTGHGGSREIAAFIPHLLAKTLLVAIIGSLGRGNSKKKGQPLVARKKPIKKSRWYADIHYFPVSTNPIDHRDYSAEFLKDLDLKARSLGSSRTASSNYYKNDLIEL